MVISVVKMDELTQRRRVRRPKVEPSYFKEQETNEESEKSGFLQNDGEI